MLDNSLYYWYTINTLTVLKKQSLSHCSPSRTSYCTVGTRGQQDKAQNTVGTLRLSLTAINYLFVLKFTFI